MDFSAEHRENLNANTDMLLNNNTWEHTAQWEEEVNEEAHIENWERPFSNLTHCHFCNFPCWKGSVSTDFLLACRGGRGQVPRVSALLARYQAAERQEVSARLDNSGGGYFWKHRAGEKTRSCLFCFLLVVLSDVDGWNVSNCLHSAVAAANQWWTKERTYELRNSEGNQPLSAISKLDIKWKPAVFTWNKDPRPQNGCLDGHQIGLSAEA